MTSVVENVVEIASSLDFKSKSEPKTFLSLRCGLQVAADDDDVLIERSEYDDANVVADRKVKVLTMLLIERSKC